MRRNGHDLGTPSRGLPRTDAGQCAASSSAMAGNSGRRLLEALARAVSEDRGPREPRSKPRESGEAAPARRRTRRFPKPRSSAGGLPSPPPARHLELAAGDEVSRAALLAFADHTLPGRHRQRLERNEERLEGVLRQGAEQRERSDLEGLLPGTLGLCDDQPLEDVHRLRGERRTREERAEGLEVSELRKQRARLLVEARGAAAERGRRPTCSRTSVPRARSSPIAAMASGRSPASIACVIARPRPSTAARRRPM